MLEIESVNHVGIRVADKDRSIAFYEGLGFGLQQDAGFTEGHPVIMKHACGVVVNLLGPATSNRDENVLMDLADKPPGYTHVALTVSSLEHARSFLAEQAIEITGSFSFGGMSAVFIRDPDRNVIELDAYETAGSEDPAAYLDHPE